MLRRPVAYEGKEPYVFISYAHQDKERIYPLIEQLQNRGLRVWYDKGLEAGYQWDEGISEHLMDCACVICFITGNFLKRENCLDEMYAAKEEQKGPVIVYLDQVTPPPVLRHRFGRLHALNRSQFEDEASLIEELCAAKMLRRCMGEIKTPVAADHVPAAASVQAADRQTEELYNRGCDYEDKEEYDQAIAFFRMAAEQGHAASIRNIGYYYEMGWAVKEDKEEAIKWYRKAAERGDAVAQRKLGEFYDDEYDYAEALYWYCRAAEHGDPLAMSTIARYYEEGLSVEADEKEAVRWYRKAAENGDLFAAPYNLGVCYELGKGVHKDLAQARFWYQKAAGFGLLSAKEALERLK